MDKKQIIQELKNYWKLNNEDYFYPKSFINKNNNKYILAFPSEFKKGGNFYTELVDFSLKPLSNRKLLVIDTSINNGSQYEFINTSIGEQLLIPLEDFKIVNSTLIEFEDTHISELTARDIICTLLKVPESNKNWINDLIKKSK